MAGHLIHVGYPKAGSTWLQHWFEAHPELHYQPGGVAGFGSVYGLCHPLPDGYRYHVTSSESLVAPHENTGAWGAGGHGGIPRWSGSFKGNQAEVCALLRTLFPASRILITTRGFMGMLASSYSQFVRTGGTLDPRGMCLPLIDPAPGPDDHAFDYDYLIGLYVDAFGADNVIVLPYELLRDDEPRFLATLEARLGVGHVDVEIGQVNPSLTPEELYWYPRMSRAVYAAAGRLPRRVRGPLLGVYGRQVFHGRLGAVARVLSRARPGAVTRADFPAEVLRGCAGRAERLRHDPLYAPYAAEYLWNEE
jgi:hypothetical protein